MTFSYFQWYFSGTNQTPTSQLASSSRTCGNEDILIDNMTDTEVNDEVAPRENHIIEQPALADNEINNEVVQQENPIIQPMQENYTLDNKFMSQFIIDSIEYYKAPEGYGYKERNARYKPNDNGEVIIHNL